MKGAVPRHRHGGIGTSDPVTGSFELIKNMNTSCVLNAIRENGKISRADIARRTGLTPATVSNITSELLELGLVEEAERGTSSGGRKPVMLSIRPKVCHFAGVHIGSDTLEAAVADLDADFCWHRQARISREMHHTRVLRLAADMVAAAMAETGLKLSGIGVCVHGLVKSEEGLSVFAPNLGWENVRIGDVFSEAFHIPVVVENDVRAMTLAENWCGFARNYNDYVYLYIGPGIGGSIVIGNELYKGAGGFAGEFGHATVEPDGPLCSCGNRGCLQAMASETTVLANYLRRVGGAGPSFTYADLLEAARKGNAEAADEIGKSAQYIGIETGNIINALSPSLIVINGQLAALGGSILSVIEKEARGRALKYSQRGTQIVFSRLGGQAQIKGAAACVIRRLFVAPRAFLSGAKV